ncbi:MAG TPA: hypothetical protein VK601_07575, partial [Kofleriaceae bacterium]|nr:hypothetical protein [Kofleriaceae bacterium]
LVPLGDLLERLSELEARLAGKSARAAGGGGGTRDRPRPAPSGPPPRPAPPPSRTAMPEPSSSSPSPSSSQVATRAAATPGPSVAQPAAAAAAAFGGSSGPASAASSAASGPPVSSGMAASSSGPPASSGPAAPDAVVEAPAPVVSTVSSPVSMQPSGPVPKPAAVASGSGPHDADAPPAVVLAIPAGPAEALRAWNDVLSELEALRKFSLLGPFQHARVLTWTAELLELGFPIDVHSMGEMARDNVDELRAIVRSLGPALKTIRVTVRLLDAGESSTAGARSVLEATRERTTAERGVREAEARAHPITKHVLQTFGAQIKEIKTDV